jgi:hypothetical protein
MPYGVVAFVVEWFVVNWFLESRPCRLRLVLEDPVHVCKAGSGYATRGSVRSGNASVLNRTTGVLADRHKHHVARGAV